MLRAIRRMPISRRLFLALLLAILVPAISIMTMGSWLLGLQSGQYQAIQASEKGQLAANTAVQDLSQLHNLLLEAHLASLAPITDPQASQTVTDLLNKIHTQETNFTQTQQQFVHNFQFMTAASMSPAMALLTQIPGGTHLASQQQQALQSIENQQWPQYKQAQDKELLLLSQHIASPAALANANTTFSPLLQNWQDVAKITSTVSTTALAMGLLPPRVLLVMFMVLLVTGFIVFTFGYIVSLTITRPLTQMVAFIRQLSKGDTQAHVPVGSARDEIALLAVAMNRMRDNVLLLIRNTRMQSSALTDRIKHLQNQMLTNFERRWNMRITEMADEVSTLELAFQLLMERIQILERQRHQTRLQIQQVMMAFHRQITVLQGIFYQERHLKLVSQRTAAIATWSQHIVTRGQNTETSLQESLHIIDKLRTLSQETASSYKLQLTLDELTNLQQYACKNIALLTQETEQQLQKVEGISTLIEETSMTLRSYQMTDLLRLLSYLDQIAREQTAPITTYATPHKGEQVSISATHFLPRTRTTDGLPQLKPINIPRLTRSD